MRMPASSMSGSPTSRSRDLYLALPGRWDALQPVKSGVFVHFLFHHQSAAHTKCVCQVDEVGFPDTRNPEGWQRVWDQVSRSTEPDSCPAGENGRQMGLLLDGCPRVAAELRSRRTAVPHEPKRRSASDRLAGLMQHFSTRFWNRPGNRTRPGMLHRNTGWNADEWLVVPRAQNRGPNLPCVLIGGCVGVAGAGDTEIGFEARSLDTALDCSIDSGG
jgi:hypothetical protein